MYIPYEKIGATLALFFPKYGNFIREKTMDLKVCHNCRFIKRNSKKVLKKIQKKIKDKEKVKVAFLCSEPAKWKCQSLFDLFLKDDYFEPLILITRNLTDQLGYTNEFVTNFFRQQNLSVEQAYDLTQDKVIDISDFGIDLIFYQQPWSNATIQGPVVSSKYALSYYVPYFIATSESWIEYGLRFHQYVHKHYVLNKQIKNTFSLKMKNKGSNLVVTGNPQIDYFYLKKSNVVPKYVIYAPHHSLDDPRTNWSTFEWSGQFILDFAKKHPDINWIFKPHPYLITALQKKNFMQKEEIDKYWGEWKKIGKICDTGNYLDLFQQSYAMITDCGSFLTEYFLTEQPVINLRRKDSVAFNSCVKAITDTYYKAYTKEELEQHLDNVILKREDPKKNERLNLLKELNLDSNYAALNILNDIKQELGINLVMT